MKRSTSQTLSTAIMKNQTQRIVETPALIRKYQRLLRLQDWDIGLSHKSPPSKEVLMQVEINRKRKHAAIRISSAATLLPEKDYQICLLHELMHVVFDEIDYEVSQSYPHQLQDRYGEARERAVDHLAKVLYSCISK